jgi:hypothetical protein
MTLDELRFWVNEMELPGDSLVVMSKDAEGNGYSPLADLEVSMYVPSSTWSGDTYATNEFIYSEEGQKQGFTEEDEAPEGAERVLVLWPVN